MMTTWVLAAFLAEIVGPSTNQASKSNPVNQTAQAVVLQLSGATMSCTKEGDHLVCVVPLDKEVIKETESVPAVAPKAQAYKASRPTLALPAPEAYAQLKAAAANVELAKSLLPKATSPEEIVLAQQILYRANEQYRTARALLHTVQGDLRRAPDPFDGGGTAMTVCQSEAEVEGCQTAAP